MKLALDDIEIVPLEIRCCMLQTEKNDTMNRRTNQLNLIVNMMQIHEARNASGELHRAIGIDLELIHAGGPRMIGLLTTGEILRERIESRTKRTCLVFSLYFDGLFECLMNAADQFFTLTIDLIFEIDRCRDGCSD